MIIGPKCIGPPVALPARCQQLDMEGMGIKAIRMRLPCHRPGSIAE